MSLLLLSDFPMKTYDKVRYADTDRQGHVNNALFSTFLETGRVEILYDRERPLLAEGDSFVIASLQVSFLAEIRWPGTVDIGTGVRSVGNSSIRLYQQLFQNGVCVASAETVIVQVSGETRKGQQLSMAAKERLSGFLLSLPYRADS